MSILLELNTVVTLLNPSVRELLRELACGLATSACVAAAADDLLVRVRERFSLQAVVTCAAGYRRYGGRRGQPPQYTLAGLCWALLARYLHGWSLRQLECELRSNALLQWATGCGRGAATPDHATLWRFENWLRQHGGDQMFVTVLKQLDEDFPAEHDTTFIGDTFGMRGAIADVSLTTLLRQCNRRLLAALAAADPGAAAAWLAHLDEGVLCGAMDEAPERTLTSAAAQSRLLTTAAAAQALLTAVTTHLPSGGGADPQQAVRVANVHHWCAILTKVLADEFTTEPPPPPKPAKPAPASKKTKKPAPVTVTTGDAPAGPPPPLTSLTSPVTTADAPAGPPPPLTLLASPGTTPDRQPSAGAPLRRCTPDERGAYRILSAVDPDATIRKHGDHITLGYNIAVLTSYDFVRAVCAFTGATPDGVTVAPVLAQHLTQQGFAPKKYLFDRAAGTPKYMAEVAHCSGGHTALIARQKQHPGRPGQFGPTAFTLTPAGLQCPNGCCTTRSKRSGSAAGWNYCFTPTQCAGCPLTAQCRDPAAKPTSPRTVFISDYAFTYQATLDYLATPAAAADFAYRSNIERINAALINHNGARRAKVRSLPKVQYQVTCAALAYNLKHWHTLMLAQEKAGLRQKPPCPTRLYPRP